MLPTRKYDVGDATIQIAVLMVKSAMQSPYAFGTLVFENFLKVGRSWDWPCGFANPYLRRVRSE
jgi:hypothetical protein